MRHGRTMYSVLAVLGLATSALAAQKPEPAAGSPDSLTRRVDAAERQWNRGDREGAMREFQAFIDIYNARSASLTSAELVAVARAVTYLGVDGPQLFKDALKAYDRAIAADPDNMDARVRLGELFTWKYNGADAKKTITDALARNPKYVPALVADARRRDFDGEPGADSSLSKALALDPENVPALVLRAQFRADVEDFAGAAREADHALKASPENGDALAIRAALYRIANDSAGYADTRRRYVALYPKEAGLLVTSATMLSHVRQYAQAASTAREATQLDPKNWRAYATLGSNQLRLGDVAAARASLETAFKGDPYDVWTKNTLDLLDTFNQYDNIATDKFRFMIEKDESAVLSLYLKEILDKAYATFQKRYAFTPTGPVRVEVYRSHADFSVRTVGLAGIGALGVSFGNVIAFDSPAAKDVGMFNWGSTAWHELAHTFTLGSSDMRVPRWLSEGLSVYEERKARPGWGQNVSPAFLEAFAKNKLVPASRLNDGFVRPAYSQQVIFSYYEASLLCEMIARDLGEQALPQMLAAYKAGQNTEQVFLRVLKMDLPTLDKRFDTYLRERFAKAMAAISDKDAGVEQYLPADEIVKRADAKPDNYWLQVAAGNALVQRKEVALAKPILERARSLFPDYNGGDGAYPALMRALQSADDIKGAAETLAKAATLGDMPYNMHLALVDLWLLSGDTLKAANALEDAMFMNPFEIPQHERLAELFARVGDKARAVRERQAVVALNPVDRAEAYYQLAIAQREQGDLASAKRSVLSALEVAPHFERAQDLLLSIVERKP
ncbi:MAG TPA: tetratricopeptide repeat protein [Gemmatimonadaceae bacterium]